MKKLVLGLLALTLGPAAAQTPPPMTMTGEPETIYSDAQREKDQLISREIVETLLAPSFSIEDQYARWKHSLCPHVYGLTPIAAWFVEHRIREVAAEVGAPLDRDDPCVPNIGIIFTVEPQASLMSIADKRPILLQGGNQKLTVKYPVQAWYATWKIDYNGVRTIDIPWELTNATGPQFTRANDSLLHTGLTAEMATATILVDSKAVTGMSLGELGDYLALMTLAQSSQYGSCLEAPTIANLMLKDCPSENQPHALSHVDIALLTALYQVPDIPERAQKQRIAGAMRRSLEAQFGK
jgi:hypothetical protein